jgi:hypothetical protein
VWRDVRLRRPAFDLIADPDHPVWYRGRPFSLERLAVNDSVRARIARWGRDGDAEGGRELAAELADLMRAPVVFDGEVHRSG